MHQQEMQKGNTGTLLLALLENEAMYGYRIVKEVDERNSGYFAFKEGTLCPALHRLEKAKLIEGRWEDTPNNVRRRYYLIAAKGQQALVERLSEWRHFMDAIILPKASPELQ